MARRVRRRGSSSTTATLNGGANARPAPVPGGPASCVPVTKSSWWTVGTPSLPGGVRGQAGSLVDLVVLDGSDGGRCVVRRDQRQVDGVLRRRKHDPFGGVGGDGEREQATARVDRRCGRPRRRSSAGADGHDLHVLVEEVLVGGAAGVLEA